MSRLLENEPAVHVLPAKGAFAEEKNGIGPPEVTKLNKICFGYLRMEPIAFMALEPFLGHCARGD
jgi:hypothetical protein